MEVILLIKKVFASSDIAGDGSLLRDPHSIDVKNFYDCFDKCTVDKDFVQREALASVGTYNTYSRITNKELRHRFVKSQKNADSQSLLGKKEGESNDFNNPCFFGRILNELLFVYRLQINVGG